MRLFLVWVGEYEYIGIDSIWTSKEPADRRVSDLKAVPEREMYEKHLNNPHIEEMDADTTTPNSSLRMPENVVEVDSLGLDLSFLSPSNPVKGDKE